MEIEAKFAADAGALRRLAAAATLAGYEVGEPRPLEVHDVYLDTAERALLRAGYACRRRATGEGVAMQVKSVSGGGGGVHRRLELEVLLEQDGLPSEWPAGEARDLVLSLAGEAPLQPLVELRQVRLLRPLTAGGREVAELSLDEVSVSGPNGPLPTYFEVEVELRPDGSEDDLALLTALLRDEWGLVPEERAKFSRALKAVDSGGPGKLLGPPERAALLPLASGQDDEGRHAAALLGLDEGLTQSQVGAHLGITSRTVRRWLRAYRADGLPGAAAAVAPAATGVVAAPKTSRPGITAADTMAAAAVKTLRFHFRRMLDHEQGTRLGEDPEELHDMRVATRRMRAALRVFDGHIAPAGLRPVRRGLQRTASMLGAVRDLDVFHEKALRYRASLPEQRRGELDPLLDVWRAEREAARARLIGYLDGERYRRFTERCAHFLDTPGAGELPPLTARGDAVPHRVADVLPAVAYERLGAVWAYAGPLAEPEPPLVRFHRLRITGKFLRYTLEFFQEVLGPEAKQPIKATKELQDHLGDLQDAVVACGVLRTLLTWGTWRPPAHAKDGPLAGVVAPGVAAYLAFRQQELRTLLDSFPPVWQKVAGPEFARSLAAALIRVRT